MEHADRLRETLHAVLGARMWLLWATTENVRLCNAIERAMVGFHENASVTCLHLDDECGKKVASVALPLDVYDNKTIMDHCSASYEILNFTEPHGVVERYDAFELTGPLQALFP